MFFIDINLFIITKVKEKELIFLFLKNISININQKLYETFINIQLKNFFIEDRSNKNEIYYLAKTFESVNNNEDSDFINININHWEKVKCFFIYN